MFDPNGPPQRNSVVYHSICVQSLRSFLSDQCGLLQQYWDPLSALAKTFWNRRPCKRYGSTWALATLHCKHRARVYCSGKVFGRKKILSNAWVEVVNLAQWYKLQQKFTLSRSQDVSRKPYFLPAVWRKLIAEWLVPILFHIHTHGIALMVAKVACISHLIVVIEKLFSLHCGVYHIGCVLWLTCVNVSDSECNVKVIFICRMELLINDSKWHQLQTTDIRSFSFLHFCPRDSIHVQ